MMRLEFDLRRRVHVRGADGEEMAAACSLLELGSRGEDDKDKGPATLSPETHLPEGPLLKRWKEQGAGSGRVGCLICGIMVFNPCLKQLHQSKQCNCTNTEKAKTD